MKDKIIYDGAIHIPCSGPGSVQSMNICVFLDRNEICLNFHAEDMSSAAVCFLQLDEIKDLRDELSCAINTIETSNARKRLID